MVRWYLLHHPNNIFPARTACPMLVTPQTPCVTVPARFVFVSRGRMSLTWPARHTCPTVTFCIAHRRAHLGLDQPVLGFRLRRHPDDIGIGLVVGQAPLILDQTFLVLGLAVSSGSVCPLRQYLHIDGQSAG